MTQTRKIAEQIKAKTGLPIISIHTIAMKYVKAGLAANLLAAYEYMVEIA
jgi:hypothetical protein